MYSVAKPSLFCSIIIPVFNHWHLVPELLDCLEKQSLDASRFEIILVDNGSQIGPKDIETAGNCTILTCTKPGSYAARNHAIKQARGKIIAFTDSDCRPHTEWLENALHHYTDGANRDLIVAGGIVVEPLKQSNIRPVEMYDMALGFRQEEYVRNGFGATANLFVPSDIFEHMGVFDGARFSGGDAAFCRRAVAGGNRITFCCDASVSHSARKNWQELKSKALRIKGGQLTGGRVVERCQYGLMTLLPPLKVWWKALRVNRLTRSQRFRLCAIQARLWLAEIVEMARLMLGGTPRRG
ncbi:glycosyltransferase family 2 protein [Alphaproteobacteria bacterium]|nr:glycosyltransferase family 2 protein [Alphaproteobacteria bacterium]